jgi:hypothetical protein
MPFVYLLFCRLAILTFDGMCITESLRYMTQFDEVWGYCDNGHQRKPLVANQVIAFVLKGVTSKWKQPIGFFLVRNNFSSIELATLIQEAITQAYDVEINVVAVICDQEVHHQMLAKDLIDEDSSFKHSKNK